MSFEVQIPQHIKTIEQAIRALVADRYKLVHVCDCAFCEVSGELADDESVAEDRRLEREISDHQATIERLRAHAKLHGIKVPGEKDGVHLRHCYQGEYSDSCKYGDEDCPAKSRENES